MEFYGNQRERKGMEGWRRGWKSGKEAISVRTRIIGPCARTLDLPLLARSGVFFFFFCLEGADFWCVFLTFSRGGNFGLHST